MRRPLTLLAAGVLVAAPLPVGAHHSFSMYDPSKAVVLKGAVKSFNWTNPHAVILVTASPDGVGTPDVWTVELTSPGNLTRIGWTRTTLAPGDKVTVEISPLRSGQHGGGFRRITLPDGRVMRGTVNDLQDVPDPAAR